MRKMAMLAMMLALTASPRAAEAQEDPTDCFSPEDRGRDEGEGFITWRLALRNDCAARTGVVFYQRFYNGRLEEFEMLGFLSANISASGGTYPFSIVWLSELAISVPTPVVAWCGFPPEDFSRCVDENDWDGGSRANWLEWPGR